MGNIASKIYWKLTYGRKYLQRYIQIHMFQKCLSPSFSLFEACFGDCFIIKQINFEYEEY